MSILFRLAQISSGRAPALQTLSSPLRNTKARSFHLTISKAFEREQATRRNLLKHRNLSYVSRQTKKKVMMRKILNLGCIGGIFLSFFTLLNSQKAYAETAVPKSISYAQETGIDWVKSCVKQYPEIRELANKEVQVTHEGRASQESPYSEQIYGEKFKEFDRTIMALHCLRLIQGGSEDDYQEFTSAQPEETRLTKESFQSLHQQLQELLEANYGGLSKEEMLLTLETASVLGDMGKSENIRQWFRPYGIDDVPDHDDFYARAVHVLKDWPGICSSFARLSEPARELLIASAHLAHFGHITHLEGGGQMFSDLKKRLPRLEPAVFAFDLFLHICDVAGAAGHVNHLSSLAYTENAHSAIQAMRKACLLLQDPEKPTMDAYNAYLEERAISLALNSEDRTDRVLIRIGAMLRLFTSEEGRCLRGSVQELPQQDRDRVIEQLELLEEDNMRTPTYMYQLF